MTLLISRLGLLVCIFLCGCSPDKSQQYSDALQSSQSRAKATVKNVKPGAPISLLSAPIINAAAGNVFQTDIELAAASQSGVLDIELLPSQGLQLRNENPRVKLDLSDNKSVKIPAILFAETNGRYYLNLHINLNKEGESTSRVLAVIVQVGDAGKSIENHKTHQTATEDLHVLPAQEIDTTP